MLIKRVVIQGFKTFAKRTEFVFDPGITAIVGPNGSGKSNVVDAIRWCLGEQSFSLLRSKKTSDIIFSGSDRRARLGLAQVSLTLDNSAGELPLDYAEIEITRRAYRDGDNEYLLNGRRVRLQDITDILAQTGLGRRTYALIGQGLIDKILSLAPEELRSLFEEAAGITGYQAKRSATLRRLEATEQNLTRVQDIVSELSPRLTHLRRQAERAIERERIAGDLRALLRDWYGYHWHHTLAELELRHATVIQLHAKVETDRTALTDCAQRIEHLRLRQSELRSELGEHHRIGSRLHREAEQVGRELAVGQERLRQLLARQEETQREIAALQLQTDTQTAQMSEIVVGLTQAQQIHDALQTRLQTAQRLVDAQQTARKSSQDVLIQARRHIAKLQMDLADQSGRVRQLQERHAAISQEQQQETEAETAASAAAKAIADDLVQAHSELATLQQAIAARKAQSADLEPQLADARKRLEPAQQTRREAERNLDRLQTRFDLLNRLNQEGAGFAAGVRSILQATTAAPKLTGILGVVATLLRVPAELDKAIEIALGGALQNIVTRRWSDTQAAIAHLKHANGGRATFLPLDRLSVLPAIPAPALPGVLGNAADLVDYDPAIAEAAQQLLNRVWIVRDLPTARAALDRQGGGPHPTVVTLDGDIVRPGGAVTGGSDQSRRDDAVLARTRELRELPEHIAGAERSLAQAVAQVNEAGAVIQTLTDALSANQRQQQEDERRAQAPRSRINELTRQLDRVQQSARWHAARLNQLTTEAAAQQSQMTQLAAQAARLEADRVTAEQTLAVAQEAVAQSESDELYRQLADLRVEAASAQADLQNSRAGHASLVSALDETRQRAQAKAEHLDRLEQEIATLHAQLSSLAGQEETLSRALAELQTKIEPSESRLADLERAQAALETEERQLQEQTRRNESAWNSAQLQFQRTDDQINRLRHDIEQDLGLVLLEVGEDLAYQPPLPWDAVVEQLQPRDEVADGLDDEIRDLRARLGRIVNVNPDAPREYAEATARHEYLLTQSTDLEAAIADLRKIVHELDVVMEAELSRTFAAVSEQFVLFFEQLFNGGSAKLVLVDPDDITNSGIEIIARPPGKRPQSLALLSGGERTLAACALIFAILRVSPTPFCVLDEVDAALDEANVDRFRLALQDLSQETQFIVITHNRRTLEGANAIYGVTMGGDSASRVISLRLEGDRIVRGTTASQPSDTLVQDADAPGDIPAELVQL